LFACESGNGAVPQDSHTQDTVDDTSELLCPLLESTSLGTVEFDATGVSGELSIEIPPDAVSFLVSVRGTNDHFYTTASLTAPDGSQWVEFDWYKNSTHLLCISCVNRVASARSGYALFVPISPQRVMQAGIWRLQLLAFDGNLPIQGLPGKAAVEVHIKRANIDPLNGSVNIRVHLSGENGRLASNAEDDPELQSALNTMGELFSQVDISIDKVSYSDVSDSFQTLHEADYESLIAESQAQPGELSFFLVGELNTDDGQLRGLTTVPGPWGAPTQRSGIVISTAPQGGDTSSTLGAVMAHELGHYLGLFHVTETALGKIHDPIPDTAPFSTNNLMSTQVGGGELTEGQGQVMRLHPAVAHSCPE